MRTTGWRSSTSTISRASTIVSAIAGRRRDPALSPRLMSHTFRGSDLALPLRWRGVCRHHRGRQRQDRAQRLERVRLARGAYLPAGTERPTISIGYCQAMVTSCPWKCSAAPTAAFTSGQQDGRTASIPSRPVGRRHLHRTGAMPRRVLLGSVAKVGAMAAACGHRCFSPARRLSRTGAGFEQRVDFTRLMAG